MHNIHYTFIWGCCKQAKAQLAQRACSMAAQEAAVRQQQMRLDHSGHLHAYRKAR